MIVTLVRRETGARELLAGTARKIVPELSDGLLLWIEDPLLAGFLTDRLGDGATTSLVVPPMRCEGR